VSQPSRFPDSLWWNTIPAVVPRPSLDGDREADVIIVGAGYTGLWTAYYLLEHSPKLDVVVVEREVAGFGASGRNGGWCSALFPARLDRIAKESSRDEAIRLQRTMNATVDEVGRVVAQHGLDVGWHKGGTVIVSRNELQLERAKADVDDAREWGFGPEDLELLDEKAVQSRIGVPDAIGGTWNAHCAAINPAKLVRGLADIVEARGATVYENTPVLTIAPGGVRTPFGTIRAPHVIRATEGYTADLPTSKRDIAPVYSLMIATEPLPESTLASIGLADRPTFSEFRNMIIYGQRTDDGRIAFGGRGAPYKFGSRTDPKHDVDERVFTWLQKTLAELFPALAGVTITNRWGGPLGIARDWWATVGLDPVTGLGWAGGYVGDGVGTSNLSGRTLADLILKRETDLVTLPWVNRRSRRWEPEPLRYLGVNTGLQAMGLADPEERKTGKPSRIAKTFDRLIHG
jgi:glycine/D-amino acid oxidase-like deaminating enzyme